MFKDASIGFISASEYPFYMNYFGVLDYSKVWSCFDVLRCWCLVDVCDMVGG